MGSSASSKSYEIIPICRFCSISDINLFPLTRHGMYKIERDIKDEEYFISNNYVGNKPNKSNFVCEKCILDATHCGLLIVSHISGHGWTNIAKNCELCKKVPAELKTIDKRVDYYGKFHVAGNTHNGEFFKLSNDTKVEHQPYYRQWYCFECAKYVKVGDCFSMNCRACNSTICNSSLIYGIPIMKDTKIIGHIYGMRTSAKMDANIVDLNSEYTILCQDCATICERNSLLKNNGFINTYAQKL